MKILFSEGEEYYRALGLKDIEGARFVFDGMRFYIKSEVYLSQFQIFVCAYYTMPHNVILTRKFNKMGIKTVLCSDGIFDFANAINNPMHTKYSLKLFHPILQDFFLCIGKNERDYFMQDTIALDFMPDRVISKEEPVTMPKIRKVLITTANTAYFNDEEYELLLRLMLDVVNLLKEENVDFSFRIFDKRLMNEIENNCDFCTGNDLKESFEDTLKRYSSVITTPSSVAVVSMFHKRPTGLLIYRNWPNFLQTGWLIPSAIVFKSNLDEFVFADESRMAIQAKLLENYDTKKGISERILEVSQEQFDAREVYESTVIRYYENMLLSRFNFNFEWFVRKVYQRLKKLKFLSNIISRLKKRIF